MNKKEKILIELLNEEWNKLKIAMQGLQMPINKCNKIGIKDVYTFEKMESFDSLSSKFSRNLNILIQKIFKNMLLLMGENAFTFIDRTNLLSKLNIIEDTDKEEALRDFRNQIIHEYFAEQITTLYPQLIDYSKEQMHLFNNTEKYLLQRNWKNNK